MGEVGAGRAVRGPKWLGGYRRIEGDGSVTFIIEREVNGKRFHKSTRCNLERSALKQLQRFEADPLHYRPEGDPDEMPVEITTELIADFHAWSTDPVNGKGNSEKHAREMTKRLKEWGVELAGVDLRKATLRDHIKPALAKWKGRQHRIIALKSFFAWLRKEKSVLRSGDDPTLDLPVPQARPEKHVRRKAVEFERVQQAFQALTPEYRDMLQLLAATGWHVSELERFVRGLGRIEKPLSPVVDRRGLPVLAVLVVRHKGGDETRVPVVEATHLEVAERLAARGTVPRRFNDALKAACEAAGIEPFGGGVLRHSVATWAIELGATPQEASDYLNHKSKQTTLRFYADVNVPTATIPTRVL